MTKLVADFKYGTLSAGIGSTDTTITSAEFADLPVVSSPDTMDLVLNPGEVGGDAEIVTVTAHTSASTSVTVAARTGSAHGSGTQWVHAVTAADFNRMGFDGTLEGNASTATALETARTIGGVSFDGTANINLPGVNTAGNQDTSGNAATATKWSAATTLSLAGDASGSVVFDGSDTTETLTVTVSNDSHTHNANNLTGSTLASGVTASSLTSVGTLTGLLIAANGSDILRLRDTGGTDTGGYISFEQSAGTRMGYMGFGNNDDIHIRNENSGGQMFFGVQAGWSAYFNTSMDFVPYTDSAHELGSSSLRWQKAWFDTVDIADDLYVGANGRGDSWMHFYDDNSNTWRTFGWDDSANSFYFEGNIQVGNGTSGAPSLSFASDSNTGFYRVSNGVIGVSCNGTLHQFKTDGLHLASGDWFRSYGTTGWYNGTYGGGMYMTDSSWVRAYNNKGISTGGTYAGVNLSTTTGSGYNYLFRNSTYSTFYYYTSTRELKENIVNVDAADAGTWIDALQPVTFIEKWLKDEEEPADHKTWREADVQTGFIAEDVLSDPVTSRFAQVVDDGNGGLQATGWKWECVIATAVAEIKALRARVATLEAG